MRLELLGGDHLRDVLDCAGTLADESGEVVTFKFNGIEHDVQPLEGPESRKARAEARCGFPILTRGEEAEQARLWLERQASEYEAARAAAGAITEQEMRDADVPWPKSEDELLAYVRTLVDRPHDYGTCVYAMSMAATAALNYVAGKLGVTGFQASCADMDILRRTRHLKHGFRLIDYADVLYPQYWDSERRPVFEALMRDPETRDRFWEEARKLLASAEGAHPTVRAHWQTLAA